MKLESIFKNEKFYTWIRNVSDEELDKIREKLKLDDSDLKRKDGLVIGKISTIKQVFNYYLYNK